jgi:phenylacetate-coenzyme A ligase PaaK-like adenylate-forming protein
MQFSKNYKNKLFSVTAASFDKFALELFYYQAEHTPIYKEFISHLNINPLSIIDIEHIPFIPIDFFKQHQIICNELPTQKVFESSGTTGMTPSKHYFHDVAFYLTNCEKTFIQFYGDLNEYAVFALLPSYIERGTSSLTAMAADFIEKSTCSFSGFYLNNYEELLGNIKAAQSQEKKIVLLGVTFALLELAERFPTDLSTVIVMETGGMKGRREEMTRSEVHGVLKAAFQLDEIHSEYGMTELNSQAYSVGNGVFETAPWLKIQLRDLNDPLSSSTTRKSGAINVIDLANVDSCSFIATQDLGRKVGENQFEVLGRIDNSDIRGCNLLVVE